MEIEHTQFLFECAVFWCLLFIFLYWPTSAYLTSAFCDVINININNGTKAWLETASNSQKNKKEYSRSRYFPYKNFYFQLALTEVGLEYDVFAISRNPEQSALKRSRLCLPSLPSSHLKLNR